MGRTIASTPMYIEIYWIDNLEMKEKFHNCLRFSCLYTFFFSSPSACWYCLSFVRKKGILNQVYRLFQPKKTSFKMQNRTKKKWLKWNGWMKLQAENHFISRKKRIIESIMPIISIKKLYCVPQSINGSRNEVNKRRKRVTCYEC